MNVIAIISKVIYGQADEMGVNIVYGFFRLALIGSILYFLYAGNKVAKWWIVITTLINVIRLLELLLLLVLNRALIAIDIVNMAIEIIYIAIGAVLIVSSPVNNFLRFQRGENKEEINDYESEN